MSETTRSTGRLRFVLLLAIALVFTAAVLFLMGQPPPIPVTGASKEPVQDTNNYDSMPDYSTSLPVEVQGGRVLPGVLSVVTATPTEDLKIIDMGAGYKLYVRPDGSQIVAPPPPAAINP